MKRTQDNLRNSRKPTLSVHRLRNLLQQRELRLKTRSSRKKRRSIAGMRKRSTSSGKANALRISSSPTSTHVRCFSTRRPSVDFSRLPDKLLVQQGDDIFLLHYITSDFNAIFRSDFCSFTWNHINGNQSSWCLRFASPFAFENFKTLYAQVLYESLNQASWTKMKVCTQLAYGISVSDLSPGYRAAVYHSVTRSRCRNEKY